MVSIGVTPINACQSLIIASRGTSQEGFHSRRAKHASTRDGATQAQSKREAQRGSQSQSTSKQFDKLQANHLRQMETINKLLKKQAPKVNKKAAAAAAAAEATPEDDSSKINPAFIRWTSTKDGCRVGVPTEMVEGPAGKLFVKKGLAGSKIVEEVA